MLTTNVSVQIIPLQYNILILVTIIAHDFVFTLNVLGQILL